MSSILAERPLICHPDTPCEALVALGARIILRDDHGWDIEFVGVGDPAALHVPSPAEAIRTDDLWRTTCFEMFIALDGDAYAELNFSPSSAWAAYHLDHYRTGMRELTLPSPTIALATEHDRLVLTASLSEDALPWDRTGELGISAVIEEQDGRMSYWALAHPPGKADFHHRDCFALRLPPVERA